MIPHFPGAISQYSPIVFSNIDFRTIPFLNIERTSIIAETVCIQRKVDLPFISVLIKNKVGVNSIYWAGDKKTSPHN